MELLERRLVKNSSGGGERNANVSITVQSFKYNIGIEVSSMALRKNVFSKF